MDDHYLDNLPTLVDAIRAIKENIITNIVLLGQIPSPTFKEKRRAQRFLERLAEFNVDECTTDGYRNPVGVVRGTSQNKAPIFVVAHLDTFFQKDMVINYVVGQNTITGPGLLDNSVGVGVLASLPQVFRHLNLQFESDIVLAGIIQSIGRGNLRGIRHLLKTWSGPIRAGVCLEGGELGRLNYFSNGMIRGEIECKIGEAGGGTHHFLPNAVLILNDVINQILKLRLPQRPRTRIVIGKIHGGVDHGKIASSATMGFEILSHSDRMVRAIYADIKDIVEGISHEYEVDLKLNTISNLNAARLSFNHPLVKAAATVLKKLELKPFSEPTESALSIFLSRKIPAVTLGLTHGDNYYRENATIEIDPLFVGIAQLVGVIQAIDRGVCDE